MTFVEEMLTTAGRTALTTGENVAGILMASRTGGAAAATAASGAFRALVGKRIAGQAMKRARFRREPAAPEHQHFNQTAGIRTITGKRRAFFALLVAGGATRGRAAFSSGDTFWGCI